MHVSVCCTPNQLFGVAVTVIAIAIAIATNAAKSIQAAIYHLTLPLIKNRCRADKAVNIRYVSTAVAESIRTHLKIEAVILICMYLIIICNIHQLNAVCNYHA